MPLANPRWQVDTHIPLPYSLIDVRAFVAVFVPYPIDRFSWFFHNKIFSCNLLHMYFYSFGQPSLTTWHPYPPSPTVSYSLINVRTFVFDFFSPMKSKDFLVFFIFCLAVIACICISMPLAIPHWQVDTHIPLSSSLIDVRTFVVVGFFPYQIDRFSWFLFITHFSAVIAWIFISMPLANPHCQLDTHIPTPLQFNWCSDVCWLFFPPSNQ